MTVDPSSDAAAELPAASGWFGVDRTGQYAFFTGAGAAVPLNVRAVLDAHDAVRAAISVPGVQSPEFPRSYARVGLFVYEWSTEQGGYRRVATPYGAVPSLLRAELSQRKEIPVLAVDDFRDSEAVGSDAWLRTRPADPVQRERRFRAAAIDLPALFDSPPMRIVLMLAVLGGLTSFYFWYW